MHTESGSESPVLSIAIPTYNRARFLDRLLSALDDQLRLQPGVELIVSDNASPDETPQIVSTLIRPNRETRRDLEMGLRFRCWMC